jgi:hypothetical protein
MIKAVPIEGFTPYSQAFSITVQKSLYGPLSGSLMAIRNFSICRQELKEVTKIISKFKYVKISALWQH